MQTLDEPLKVLGGADASPDGPLRLLAAIAVAAIGTSWALWTRYGLLGSARGGARPRTARPKRRLPLYTDTD